MLNASYEAIRILPAWKALKLVTKGKAYVELPTRHEVYPGIFLPSVIRLRVYRHIPIRMQIVTRRNLYQRDGYRCGYCGHKFRAEELTLDHVIPKSRGGSGSWENLVSACGGCNRRKDNRTPEEAGMPLLHRPLPITVHTSRMLLRSLGSEVSEWRKYLWHDNEGDRRFAAVN